MAIRSWLGRATAVQQVVTVQITGNDAATTYKLTVGGVVVSTTGAGSATLTAAALATAWNASAHPYFTYITAANNSSDTVTLTVDSAYAGVPFTVTSSVTGGAGTIGSATVATANAGPNVWGTAANWTGSTVPTTGDTVIIQASDVDILFDLDQSGVTLAKLEIKLTYTGKIGLPENSFRTTEDDTDASEYRDTYLKIGATVCNLGVPSGVTQSTGSTRIKLNFGAAQTTCAVYGTATSSADTGLQPVRLLGTHASNALYVESGQVGVATTHNGSEASTFATVATGGSSGGLGSGAGRVELGSNCTLTSIHVGSGQVVNHGANVTTVNLSTSGSYTVYGTATHTTINAMEGSTLRYNSSGTLTTLTLAGKADFSQDARAKTITNFNAYVTADINLDNGNPLSITLSNGIDCLGFDPGKLKLKAWPHVTVTLSQV